MRFLTHDNELISANDSISGKNISQYLSSTGFTPVEGTIKRNPSPKAVLFTENKSERITEILNKNYGEKIVSILLKNRNNREE